MKDSMLMMTATASGLILGGLLHLATPTEISQHPGRDWRDSIPRHPDPAALVSRDVNAEYVAFDYHNAREFGSPAVFAALDAPAGADLPPLPPAPHLSRAAIEPMTPAASDSEATDQMALAEVQDTADGTSRTMLAVHESLERDEISGQ